MNPITPQRPLIRLENVDRFFGGSLAKESVVISDLSLEIAEGEFLTLLGPSGCGKSTLLKLIANLDQPNRGVVRIESGKAKFGFVFQEAHLLPWRNVLENVMLPFELQPGSGHGSGHGFGAERKAQENRCREVLQSVGLQADLSKYPAQLSGGMKMRVSVARALVASPRILLLDEPFAALDEHTRFRLQEDLRSLCLQENLTVVFVTHSISEAVFLSDRAVVLSDRPARIVFEHRSTLPRQRAASLRFSAEYYAEIEALSQAFQKGLNL